MRVAPTVLSGLTALSLAVLQAPPARGQRIDYGVQGDAVAGNPIVQRWHNTRNGRLAGPKDPGFRAGFIGRCSANFLACDLAHEIFMGNNPPNVEAMKQYTQDSLELYQDKNRRWAPLLFVSDMNIRARAPYATVMFKTPNAGALLGKWLDSPEKEKLLCTGTGEPAKNVPRILYQTLFYLGAKDQVDTMIAAFDINCANSEHLRAAAHFLHNWTLTAPQSKKMVDYCIAKAFQATNNPGRWACIRYLGRIGVKNPTAHQFLVRYMGSESERLEAIRAIAHLELKAAKEQLLQNVKRAEAKRSVFEKRGKRMVRKEITGWSSNWNSLPSAVALAAMGDKYARKAIAFWLTVPADGKINDLNTFSGVFREAVFTSPKARKALKGDLQKAYKAAERAFAKTADINLGRHVGNAAISLVQMGDTTGMKGVLKVLNGSDNAAIRDALAAFGGEPHQAIGNSRGPIGIGHLLVGKDGLSVKDASVIAATIKKQFSMWSDKNLRTVALHAYYDVLARIDAVTRRL